MLQQCKSVVRKKPSDIETHPTDPHLRQVHPQTTDRSASHKRKDAFFLTGKSKTMANIDSVKKAYGITDQIQTPKYFRRLPAKLPAMIRPVSREVSQEGAFKTKQGSSG